MTNKEAFMIYYPDGSTAEFVLGTKSIDPAETDNVDISGAWGMIESCTNPDYSQGRTSETLSSSARNLRLTLAKKILAANGITWTENNIPKVGKIQW